MYLMAFADENHHGNTSIKTFLQVQYFIVSLFGLALKRSLEDGAIAGADNNHD
jgi:hypothetical protein